MTDPRMGKRSYQGLKKSVNIVLGLLAKSIEKGTLPSCVARLVKHKPRAVTFTSSKKWLPQN